MEISCITKISFKSENEENARVWVSNADLLNTTDLAKLTFGLSEGLTV